MVYDKSKTSLAKFEEFFSTQYKDEIFEVLENVSEERSILVDYNDLEMFDPDLADLLIEKPEEVLAAARKATKNIDPLMNGVELNVRFKNLTNIIPLNKISSRYIGKFVKVRGSISNLEKVSSRIETGVFECRGCMRLFEVGQYSHNVILEPSMCHECGGRSFNLLKDESKYIDAQGGILKDILINPSPRDEVKTLTITMEDDLAGELREKDVVFLTGILKTYSESKKFKLYLEVNHIEFLEKWGEIDLENIDNEFTNDRQDPRYNTWRKEVLERDKVCQCCGFEKRLHVHHINGYEEYSDLRFDTGNGIVLCQFCHDKYHSAFGLKNINGANFAKFIKQFGIGGIINQPIMEDNSKIKENNTSEDKSLENIETFKKSIESDKDNVDFIFKTLLGIEKTNGYVSYSELKSKCGDLDIDEEFLNRTLSQLKNKGMIYEFKIGKYRSI